MKTYEKKKKQDKTKQNKTKQKKKNLSRCDNPMQCEYMIEKGDKLVKFETQLHRSLLTIRSAKSHFNKCDQWMKCGDMNTQVTIMHWWHVDPQETVW